MNSKKLLLPKILVIIGIVISIILNIFLCTAKAPTVTDYTFPFSITYEFGGNTVTIEDEFICTYTGAGESVDPKDRFYDGYCANGRDDMVPGEYTIQTYEDGELVIITNHFAGYLMGDPLYEDHYTEYYRHEPYVAFYVYDEYTEYYDEETLARYDVRIVDWDYPTPLENTFVFSNLTRLTRETVLAMAGIALLVYIACLIFVKKDRNTPYNMLDKTSVIINLAIMVAVFPFLLIACTFIDINGNASGPLSQAMFFVPALTCYGIAASVSLRRKGFSKSGFAAQFVGLAYFALLLAIEAVSSLF